MFKISKLDLVILAILVLSSISSQPSNVLFSWCRHMHRQWQTSAFARKTKLVSPCCHRKQRPTQTSPEEWGNLQSERKRSKAWEQHATALTTESAPMVETFTEKAPSNKNRKRNARPEDEIDALFNEKLGKRTKNAALSEINRLLTVLRKS